MFLCDQIGESRHGPQSALTESMENYLEAILNLEKTQKVARVKDIADKLSLQRGIRQRRFKNPGGKRADQL